MVQKVREVTVCAPRRYGRYRYFLEVRIMGEPAPTLTVILKNPSTASAESSDPTVGKVEAWARKNKFCRIRYVNLFALRSPYPEELNAHSYRVMVGRENDAWIERSLQGADVVLAAWGNRTAWIPRNTRKESPKSRACWKESESAPWELRPCLATPGTASCGTGSLYCANGHPVFKSLSQSCFAGRRFPRFQVQ